VKKVYYDILLNMLDKKLTRKQFILSGLSLFGILLMNKIPKNIVTKHKTNNSYGGSTYGGK
jgi:hypothetical protein